MAKEDLSALGPLPGGPSWPPQGLTTGPTSRSRSILYWLAIGLASVSVSSGLLYHFHYTRVGNRVTALLPRDTLFYARFEGRQALVSGLTDLGLWESSRPVRRLVHDEEDSFFKSTLFDLNISRGYLNALENGVSGVHLAAVGATPEVLVCLEFTDRTAEEEVRSLLQSAFDDAGMVEGIPLRRRRLPGRVLHAAMVDGLAVFAHGGDAALRQLLESRTHSQSRTLNDSDAFRHAWLNHPNPAHFFAFAAPEALAALSPVPAALGLTGGLGLGLQLDAGADRVSATGQATPALARSLAVDTKRTLAAVPSTAMSAIAFSVGDPVSFTRALQRILRTPDLNELQALSARSLTRDLFPLVAGEVALAVVPEPLARTEAWLAVIRSHDAEQMADVVEDIARTWIHTVGQPARVGATDGGTRLLTASLEGPELLAWTVSGSNLLLGSSAEVVNLARTAEQTGDGLSQLPSVAAVLATLPVRNSALAVGRLRELLLARGVPKRLATLVHNNFIAAAAVTVKGEEVQLQANVSPLSIGLLALAERRTPTRPESCKQLVRRVCAGTPDCGAYRAMVRGASNETCDNALTRLAHLESGI